MSLLFNGSLNTLHFFRLSRYFESYFNLKWAETKKLTILINDTFFPATLVPRAHVKIAINVGKAWNLARMKLLSCRSKKELGAFRQFSPFVCMPIWLLQTQVFH